MKKIVFIFMIIFMNFFMKSFSQTTRTITFNWTNPNPVPVSFDIIEFGSLTDTVIVIRVVNSSSHIPNCTSGCSYSSIVTLDNKEHFYRMVSINANGSRSCFSNVCSILLSSRPKPPGNFSVKFLSN